MHHHQVININNKEEARKKERKETKFERKYQRGGWCCHVHYSRNCRRVSYASRSHVKLFFWFGLFFSSFFFLLSSKMYLFSRPTKRTRLAKMAD
jgi:hypothetical protein